MVAPLSVSRLCRTVAALAVAACILAPLPGGQARAASTVDLTFYYPVGVAGPLTTIMTNLVNQFNAGHPGIKVDPIFAGDYVSTSTKVQAAISGGKTPDVAVLLSTDLFSFLDQKVLLQLDGALPSSYLKDFWPAFMANATVNGHVYSIPFQRSTPILYYNKAAFQKAGLNPNRPPATWSELIADAQKLTTKSGGKITQYGVELPSSGTVYWVYQGLALQAGNQLMNSTGTQTYFDSPGAVAALKFWISLSKTYGVMPSGIVDWGATPTDFDAGKVAMVYHSTGSLTSILKGANFPVGTAFMPADKSFGAPTGGGNLYVFKNIPTSHQQAALTFVQWMTSPAIAANWSIATGYVAVRQSAYHTPAMRAYIKTHPQALVARDQLKYAYAELATHQDQQIHKILDDALQAAITGQTSPESALHGAQQQSMSILSQFGQ